MRTLRLIWNNLRTTFPAAIRSPAPVRKTKGRLEVQLLFPWCAKK